jgi:hypothetical protein
MESAVTRPVAPAWRVATAALLGLASLVLLLVAVPSLAAQSPPAPSGSVQRAYYGGVAVRGGVVHWADRTGVVAGGALQLTDHRSRFSRTVELGFWALEQDCQHLLVQPPGERCAPPSRSAASAAAGLAWTQAGLSPRLYAGASGSVYLWSESAVTVGVAPVVGLEVGGRGAPLRAVLAAELNALANGAVLGVLMLGLQARL